MTVSNKPGNNLAQILLQTQGDVIGLVDPDGLWKVLTASFGHFVDAYINSTNSTQDEGANSSQLVRGERTSL